MLDFFGNLIAVRYLWTRRVFPSNIIRIVMSQRDHEKRLDYVEFRTTNIEATQRFYQKVFGWKFEDYGPNYTSFYDGRLYGGFWLADEIIASSPLIVIYAWDLPSVMEEVKEAGGSIVKDIFSFPGGERFHFQDPSGNELAVWSDASES